MQVTTAEATVALMTFLSAHLDSHRLYGRDWPATAQFAVAHRYSTWPLGWGRERFVDFFDTREQMDAWLKKQFEWAKLEDNHFAYQVYEWDLGPKEVVGSCWCAGNV